MSVEGTGAAGMVGKSWIQTYTGKQFFPGDPQPDSLDIYDIMHALSNIARFTGHTKEFYSVAQHCVLVSWFCDAEDAREGFAHDWSEAYLMDIASPVKRMPELAGYKEIELRIQAIIAEKWELTFPWPDSVHKADRVALATEARDLMGVDPQKDWNMKWAPARLTVKPLPPKQAKILFRQRAMELGFL